MSFYETRFPTEISYGSAGGPRWKTDVIVVDSGRDQRNQRWSNTRHEYDVAYGVKTQADLKSLIEFFMEMRGRAYGFRYKDPLFNSVTDEALTPDGSPTIQLIKTFGNGFNDYEYTIKKPVAGITMERNGASYTGFTLDTTTGILTLDPLSSVGIDNIVSASPNTLTQITTTSAHGLSSGETVYIKDATGVTSLNGNTYTVTVVDTTNFTITADTSSETYSSAGTVETHVQPSDTLTWSGSYDIPVRFDTDELSVNLTEYQAGSTSCPLVEVRL